MTHTLTKMSRWFRSGVYFIVNHKVHWGPYNIFVIVNVTSRLVLTLPSFLLGSGRWSWQNKLRI